MLELKHLSVTVGDASDEKYLLTEVSASFPSGHLCAIIGPSGCGKSTLLKSIAGLSEPALGSLHWKGRDLVEEEDLDPHEIGYVPQFSISFDRLDVWESVETAVRLRVGNFTEEQIESHTGKILHEVGLDGISDRRVGVLSGGQRRRLSLALEMVTSPSLLLADEVTSGLDPKSEEEIVALLRSIASHEDRIVLSVTHSLRHADQYDSILVLHEGHIAYHGPPKFLCHYFDVTNHEDIFSRLTDKRAASWHRSWEKHHGAFYDAMGLNPGSFAEPLPVIENPDRPDDEEAIEPDSPPFSLPLHGEGDRPEDGVKSDPSGNLDESPDRKSTAHRLHKFAHPPDARRQFAVLFGRRLRLFARDPGQILLHLAMIVGFPVLVAIFALDGIPAIRSLEMGLDINVVERLVDAQRYVEEASRSGSLVSGIVMLQVILLTLMGANNAAREIAGERLVFEKEKLGGVRASSYVASKFAFLAILVAAQSLWMGVFVKWICRFPGNFAEQLMLLFLVNAAVTAVSLAISSLSRTPEQASLVSVYLVGFQLPLSGAVLALPVFLSDFTKPFIAAYWSWSGILQTMQHTPFFEAVKIVAYTDLSPILLCLWVLSCHIVIGGIVAWLGCRRSQWE